MDTKVKGIILKLTDFKEADKLASVFSLENGIISAKFTGVKKEKAKLKAVAQPFCFAEFVLNSNTNFYTVTGANVIDNFFEITTNYDKTICAYILVDILQTILEKQVAVPEIFLLTVECLKNIEQKNEFVALINFIIKFTYFSGVEIVFEEGKFVMLDKATGNFVKDKTEYSVSIDNKVYQILKDINNQKEVSADSQKLKQALRLLHTIICAKFGVEIKTFSYL